MTSAQREGLELLQRLQGRQVYTTSGASYGCFISGVVAKSLVSRGLARYTRGYPVGTPGATLVAITQEGIERLEAAK